jgi:hypothetical protein
MTVAPEPHAVDDETRRTLHEVRRVARLLLQGMEPDEGDGSLLTVLESHLGTRPDTLPVTTEEVPQHRVVDADIALSEIAGRDAAARLLGLGGGEMKHHMTFADQLQHARMGGGGSLGQVEYLQKATGPAPDDHRNVVAMGLWLFHYDGHPMAVRQQAPTPRMGRPTGSLDVLAVDGTAAKALVAEVRELMDQRSVFRGQVVTFATDPYGPGLAGISFVERPTLTRDDLVLPDGLLDRVSEHVVGIAAHRDVLAAGSTSSAACSSSGLRAPGKRTPCGTCSARAPGRRWSC